MSGDKLEYFGLVVEHSRDVFRIRLDETDNMIIKAKISGKMRLHKIDLQVGDKVKVEVSPYDTSQGRIVSRLRTAKDQRAFEEEQNPE